MQPAAGWLTCDCQLLQTRSPAELRAARNFFDWYWLDATALLATHSSKTGTKGDYPLKTSQGGELLFRVMVPGREYRIFTNGRVEGFGDDVKVVNRFFQCADLLQAVQSEE